MPTATRSSPDVRQSAQPKSVWYERLTKAAAYSLPEIPIILAALIYTNSRGLQRSLGAIAFYYPYAMFGAGLLLGWRFHRSRLLFALLVLALVDRSLLAFVASHGFTRDHVAFQAIAFLLPLNLAALALTAERGVFTPPGLVRLSVILGQVALVAILDRGAPGAAGALLHARLLPPSWFAWTPLADPALLAFLVAAGLMGAARHVAQGAERWPAPSPATAPRSACRSWGRCARWWRTRSSSYAAAAARSARRRRSSPRKGREGACRSPSVSASPNEIAGTASPIRSSRRPIGLCTAPRTAGATRCRCRRYGAGRLAVGGKSPFSRR